MRSVESESQTAEEQPGLLTIIIVAALFTAWSLLHVPIPGVNEPHYLCKARAAADAAWCARDFFLHSTNAHAVFLGMVGPLTNVLSFAVVAVMGRVVGGVVLGWGWCRLAAAFELRQRAALYSAGLFGAIVLTGNLSGEWVLGGFESKVPAFGFAFASVAAWLQRRSDTRRSWLAAGAFAGIAVSLHPVVGCWFIIGIGMATIADALLSPGHSNEDAAERADGHRSAIAPLIGDVLVMGVAAVFTALPGLVPVFRMLSSSTLSAEDRGMADRLQVFVRLKHHLDPTRIAPWSWWHSLVLLVLIAAGCWWIPKGDRRLLVRRTLLLLASAIVIAGAGIVIGWHRGPVADLPAWSARAFLLKFYPFRFVDALMPVSLAFLAARVLQSHVPAFVQTVRPAIVILVVVLGAAFMTRSAAPGGYSVQAYADWQEGCEWIQENTPADSLVFTPRESFGFKWFAERAEYVCFKDCPQDAEGILEWNRRLETVDWLDPRFLQKQPTTGDIRRLRKETDVTHVMTRRFTVAGLEPVFENLTWRIYDLRFL